MGYRPTGLEIMGNILMLRDEYIIYYDSDIDGAISGELTRRLLELFGKKYEVHINENRQHGMKLTSEQLSKLRGKTIILVDASVTKEEIAFVLSHGVNIIVIDHHNITDNKLVHIIDENTSCQGVIINNQYPFEPEEYRFLSGAGVVYYVIEGLFPNLFGNDERALVGLSLLSDIRPLNRQRAVDFLHVTYNHKSPMIDYLINITKPEKDFGFGEQTFDRNFIDYTFSPKVNSLFRLNRGQDAINLFKGEFKSKASLDVYRGIQNSIRDTIMKNLQGYEESHLIFKYVNKSLRLPYDQDITNFIGLACSQVKNGGKTTILLVKDGDKVIRGSVRGQCDGVDYLSIFRKYGVTCEGHKNAFGVMAIDFDKFDIKALNHELSILEEVYTQNRYNGRILDVNNLDLFLQSQNVAIANRNNYLQDSERILIRYRGNNILSNKYGKATEYIVDGVRVMSFSDDLTIENSLILPILERGSYINFYLRKF